jgi:hypothetical protein
LDPSRSCSRTTYSTSISGFANDNTALPAGRYTMKDAVKLLDVHAVSGAGDTIVDRVS